MLGRGLSRLCGCSWLNLEKPVSLPRRLRLGLHSTPVLQWTLG